MIFVLVQAAPVVTTDEYITLTFGSEETPPPEEEECFDSDGGKDYYEKGYVDDFGERRWDNCFDEDTLLEYYCEQAPGQTRPSRTASYFDCSEGCDDGVCLGEEPLPEEECTDSDGGKNYAVKGYATTDGGNTKHWDSCSFYEDGTEILHETYCENNTIKTESHTCLDGCDDGACLGEEPSDKPDLVASNITYSPDPINAGDAVGFSFTYSNIGDTAAPQNWYEVSVDGDVIYNYAIVGLNPGDSRSIGPISGWTATDGTHTVSIVVDSQNSVVENNENNNEATLSFTVGEAADLAVAGLGYSPPSVDVGDEVRFQFTYSNVGDASLPGSPDTPYLYVKVYVDDELVIEEGVYEGLGAGESRDYTTKGSWTATAGSHTVRAIVESPLLEEPDTTDNEAVLAMTVPTPAGEGPAGQVCNICGCTASGGDCGGQTCNQKCHQCLAKDRKWIADENRYEYAYTYTILGCLPVKPASFVIWFLRFAMGIGGGIAFLFMVMGVFKVLTSQGDVNKLIDGKKMISGAILGILVIVFAVIILRIIGLDILRLPGFNPSS